MTVEQRSTAQKAFTMLLKSILPFTKVVELEEVFLRGEALIVRVRPQAAEIEHIMVAQAVAQLQTQLERQCFEVYQHQGYFIQPRVNVVEPVA